MNGGGGSPKDRVALGIINTVNSKMSGLFCYCLMNLNIVWRRPKNRVF